MRVSWGEISGEQVEDFVSQLILLHFHELAGNRIRPSRGDRGIDVRFDSPEGMVVYQIKKYCKTLTSRQRAAIKESFDTFMTQVARVSSVASWVLVMPLDPTNEDMAWFSRLTEVAPFKCTWMGRTQLDAMAATMPALVEYHFGDSSQLKSLLLSMLQVNSAIPEHRVDESAPLVLADRANDLVCGLNRLDPHYRYSIELLDGLQLDNVPVLHAPSGRVASHFHTLEQGRVLAIHTIARCAASTELRPIKGTVRFEVPEGGDSDRALRDFAVYGKPFREIAGEIAEAEGPPFTISNGSGLISFLAPQGASLPPLSLRLSDEEGGTVLEVPLSGVQSASGATDEPGVWIRGYVANGLIEIECHLHASQRSVLGLKLLDCAGRPATEAIEVADFLTALKSASSAQLFKRHTSAAVFPRWDVGQESIDWSNALRMCASLRALASLQAYLDAVVIVPPTFGKDDLSAWENVARLCAGEVIETSWTSISISVDPVAAAEPAAQESVAMVTYQPLTIQIGGRAYDFRKRVQVACSAARIVCEVDQEGGSIGEDPGVRARVEPVDGAPLCLRIVD